MRKFKILPSILMLVLCVGILAVGIYAVSPAQNNVTGTITVIASNVEVEITAYLGTAKTTKVSDTIIARTSTPVPIYDNELEFDGSSASSSDAVEDITLVLEIKNNSASKALGAFFLKDASLPETLTSANITKSISFDGKTTDNTKTATNLVTASLPGYTQISAGATVDLVCTLSLNELTDYDMNVALDLPLVIHDYDSEMLAGSISLFAEKGVAESLASLNVSTFIDGEYAINNLVELSVSTEGVPAGYGCNFTWYVKDSSGTWTKVGVGTEYEFVVTSTNGAFYKVVYDLVEGTTEVIIASLTCGMGYFVVTSGVGVYNIGDTVTITIELRDWGNGLLMAGFEYTWVGYAGTVEHKIATKSNEFKTYTYVLTESSPTVFYISATYST